MFFLFLFLLLLLLLLAVAAAVVVGVDVDVDVDVVANRGSIRSRLIPFSKSLTTLKTHAERMLQKQHRKASN